jgi:hypothetical protein
MSLQPRATAHVALVVLLGGCLVEPLPDEPVYLSFGVGLPPVGVRTRFAATNESDSAACKDQTDNDGDGKIDCKDEDCLPFCTPWDGQGYFRLGWPDGTSAPRFPKLVRVAVEVNGLELKSGTWPDETHGIGGGESSTGEVQVELQVQAGEGRRLRALGFLHDGQDVLTYEETGTVIVDLVAGKTQSVDLQMARRATAAASITVRCESGSGGSWQPRGVALADARALVIYPEIPLHEDAMHALVAKPQVPVGRFHWVRAILEHVTTRAVRYIDKRQLTFVTTAGQDTPVTVTLPCEIL